MKTFDEAWAEVVTEKELTSVNITDGYDHITNTLWRDSMLWIATEIVRKSSKAGGGTDVMVAICTGLHIAFECGLLTGIKMERTEE